MLEFLWLIFIPIAFLALILMVDALVALNGLFFTISFGLWGGYVFPNPIIQTPDFRMVLVGILLSGLGIFIWELKMFYLGKTKSPEFEIPEEERRSPKLRFIYSISWRLAWALPIILFTTTFRPDLMGLLLEIVLAYLIFSTANEHYNLHFKRNRITTSSLPQVH